MGDTFDGISSRELLVLSVFSALFYVLLSLGIYHWFYERGLALAFDHGLSISSQVLVGSGAGIIAAGGIRFLAIRPPVSGILDDFYLVRKIRQARFTAFDRIQLSIFAGAGEELLFRGAIQPLLGIWLTSVIFVGIHGYFKFKTAGHWLFGGLMFGLSMLLGVLFNHAGLISVMTAHAVYDVIMLWLFRNSKPGTQSPLR